MLITLTNRKVLKGYFQLGILIKSILIINHILYSMTKYFTNRNCLINNNILVMK